MLKQNKYRCVCFENKINKMKNIEDENENRKKNTKKNNYILLLFDERMFLKVYLLAFYINFHLFEIFCCGLSSLMVLLILASV